MSVSTPVNIEQVFSAQEIAQRVAELGLEFRSAAREEDVFVLSILKGTICFAADLLRATPGPVSYGFVDVIRDVLDTETAAALEIDFLSFTGITGRNVFLLKDVEGLSYEEIAEITGDSVPAIKSRLHRARLTMRSAIDAFYQDVESSD